VEELQRRAGESGGALTRERWAAFALLQRFVLLKLYRPGHEHLNFLPALMEFGLA
jgi:hypothetical protein